MKDEIDRWPDSEQTLACLGKPIDDEQT